MRTQYTFPIITKKQVKNLEHVFPLQQEAVVKICDALKITVPDSYEAIAE